MNNTCLTQSFRQHTSTRHFSMDTTCSPYSSLCYLVLIVFMCTQIPVSLFCHVALVTLEATDINNARPVQCKKKWILSIIMHLYCQLHCPLVIIDSTWLLLLLRRATLSLLRRLNFTVGVFFFSFSSLSFHFLRELGM